ncbi:Fic family protein [Leeuwenhoekiella sp. H156]|uniref:Fic family protein n=1 Tax=Leeuwenhoekiella sp. H156 TaxID=3450128 RepID=UPI003FA46315
MEENKHKRLWDYVELTPNWLDCDTSALDDISPSWYERREVLQSNSKEYQEFITELKREHAIETGIVEKMYDLEKGITETFIKEGFYASYISHTDTNVPIPKLLSHLSDHLNAVDFVFDVVKENRELTIGFIKELHALVTRNQEITEGRDQFGNKTNIPLIKGKFKVHPNNPSREDGIKIEYCPPEHVESEMDNLVKIYNDADRENIHPLICATWFHHAFTIIHPFQDGNGRVARLLASLILIKNGLFPFTVLREEAKVKYITALEKADLGEPQMLVNYFAEVQKRHIEKALNLKEVSSSSFEEIANIFTGKVEKWQKSEQENRINLLNNSRNQVFDFCLKYLNETKNNLEKRLNGGSQITIEFCSPEEDGRQYFYQGQIIKYAKKHDYYFNRTLPKGWITFRIDLSETKRYQLGITLHHYGYDDKTLALGAFLEFFQSDDLSERIDSTLPLEIKPHVISISKDIESKEKNIRTFLENAVTLTLAQIASEL